MRLIVYKLDANLVEVRYINIRNININKKYNEDI